MLFAARGSRLALLAASLLSDAGSRAAAQMSGGHAQMSGGHAPLCAPRSWLTTAGEASGGALRLQLTELGAQNVQTARIQSFYWWDGKVQNDAEELISFESARPAAELVAMVGAAHPYDTPMLISECDDEQSGYWRGQIDGGSATLAQALTEARLVACAQLSASTLSVKTVAGAKARVESALGGVAVAWRPIIGNTPYLDWIRAETDPALGS